MPIRALIWTVRYAFRRACVEHTANSDVLAIGLKCGLGGARKALTINTNTTTQHTQQNRERRNRFNIRITTYESNSRRNKETRLHSKYAEWQNKNNNYNNISNNNNKEKKQTNRARTQARHNTRHPSIVFCFGFWITWPSGIVFCNVFQHAALQHCILQRVCITWRAGSVFFYVFAARDAPALYFAMFGKHATVRHFILQCSCRTLCSGIWFNFFFVTRNVPILCF